MVTAARLPRSWDASDTGMACYTARDRDACLAEIAPGHLLSLLDGLGHDQDIGLSVG